MGRIEMVGKTYGQLKVIKEVDGKRGYYLCRCLACGNESVKRGDHIRERNGDCGCSFRRASSEWAKSLRELNTKHGMCRTRLYSIWCNMKNRCYNDKIPKYKNYGARGIVVCDEWRDDYVSFYNWAMASGYTDKLTIDRIDVNGNYEPQNCRWVTMKAQSLNKTDSRYIEIDGVSKTVSEWAEVTGTKYNTIHERLRKGLSGREAVFGKEKK